MSARFAAIDALRGFAALWVFAYHLWNVYCPGCSPQTEPIPLAADTPVAVVATFPVFAYGYTGVGLFFVLSGFCIHLPQSRRFHATGADALDPREFARRRFWRLYPAFLASLFLASLGLGAMNWVHANPPGANGVDGDYIRNAFGLTWLLPNAVFALPLAPSAHKLNPVAWTLIYELQFYLLYPLLLKAVRHVGFGKVGAMLLACELLFAFAPTPDALKGVAPHFEWFFLRRYFDWFLGMWLAERLASGNPLSARWGKRLFLAGVIGGPLASGFAVSWPLHHLLLVIGSAGLVAWAVARPNREPNRLTRLFAPAGDWSYSLYLVHMPMLRLLYAGCAVLPAGWIGEWGFAAACVALIPLTAVMWYRLFEKPYLPGATKASRDADSRPAIVARYPTTG